MTPSYAEIPDNGRRGAPISGCDCVQCFGRCLVDQDVALREGLRRSENNRRVARDETEKVA